MALPCKNLQWLPSIFWKKSKLKMARVQHYLPSSPLLSPAAWLLGPQCSKLISAPGLSPASNHLLLTE